MSCGNLCDHETKLSNKVFKLQIHQIHQESGMIGGCSCCWFLISFYTSLLFLFSECHILIISHEPVRDGDSGLENRLPICQFCEIANWSSSCSWKANWRIDSVNYFDGFIPCTGFDAWSWFVTTAQPRLGVLHYIEAFRLRHWWTFLFDSLHSFSAVAFSTTTRLPESIYVSTWEI